MTQPTPVTFTLTEDAFMRGCHQLWAHRALGRAGNLIIAAILIGISAFLFRQGVPGPWAVLGLIGAALIIGMDVMRDRIWRRYYRSLIKYTGPITAIFSDDGVGVQSQEATQVVPWAQFQSFAITKDFLFLLINQRSFSVIPLSVFETPTARAQAEALCARHLKRLKSKLL